MSLDMSLARGLDYYTGVIYEAVCEASAPPGFSPNPPVAGSGDPSSNPPPPKPAKKAAPKPGEEEEIDESQVGVGSIAAGGRYDELVGMFAGAASGAGKKEKGIPCVGVSVGVERVFSILLAKMKEQEKAARSKETDVYVMSLGDGMLVERMTVVKKLWDAGIKVRGFWFSPRTTETLTSAFLRPSSCTKPNRNRVPNLST